MNMIMKYLVVVYYGPLGPLFHANRGAPYMGISRDLFRSRDLYAVLPLVSVSSSHMTKLGHVICLNQVRDPF